MNLYQFADPSIWGWLYIIVTVLGVAVMDCASKQNDFFGIVSKVLLITHFAWAVYASVAITKVSTGS